MLLAYGRTLCSFVCAARPRLSFSAFARLFAMNVRDLPQASFLKLGGKTLGFRQYHADSDVHLVLIHGAGCFGDQLHHIARAVSQAGLAQAYTLNMSGHGLSDGARGHAVSYPSEIVEDVGKFLDALRHDAPHGKIILCGHSAGGGVVLGVSRTQADRLVDGYVFLAPYLGLGSPTVRPFFGGWTRLRILRLAALIIANLLGIERFNNNSVVDFDTEACLHDPRFVKNWSFNTMQAFSAGRWLPGAKPIAAHKPVLLLAGEQDECFKQPLYQDALAVIAPHGEMPMIGSCGHFDLLVNTNSIKKIENWLGRYFPFQASSEFNQESFHAVAN